MSTNFRLAARRHLLASTALLPVMAAGPVLAQAPNAAPTGGQVVAGSAAISQSGTTTTINQSSNRAAIDWRSFNVGSNQSVQFNQPNAGSWTLNRVTTPDPSLIAGRITANGGVAIVNQSGVVFTPGAQVNVGSLIASAANITNENFMAGRMVFDGPARPGARVENHGSITVADRGLASLVAPGVANSGLIRARLGRVALAGAETFTLDLAGDGLVSLDVTQSVRQGPGGGVALVTNSGVVEAAGGSVLLTADAARGVVDTLVRNTGRISVDAASGQAAGQVAITGSGGDVRLEGGRVSATGTAPGVRGGRVSVTARDGAVVVGATATVDASGAGGGGSVQLGGAETRRVAIAGQVSARGTGASVRGGLVAAQAKQDVLVEGGGKLDASGTGGGGTVLAGTTGFGRGQEMAETTRIAAGATLVADATEAGTGGLIAVNSTARTEMRGAISARGGAAGGDGGFVEISGQGAFSIAGTVDVRAPAGRNGTLFLDPNDIVIVNGADDSGLDGVAGTVVATEAGLGDPANITNGTIAAFAGTVRLEAVDTLTVSAAVTKANGGLTLVAGTSIAINADITLSGAGDGFTATSGTISGNGVLLVADGSSIVLRSDVLTLTGALNAGATGLVEIGPRTAGAAYTATLPAGGVTAGRLRLGETRSGDFVDWGQDPLAQGTTTAGVVTVSSALDASGISLELIGASVAVEAAVTALDITLRADTGDITQTAAGRLTGNSLSAVATGGSVDLTTATPRNAVGAVTGSASDNFAFSGSQAVTVGPVTAGDDLTITATAVTVTGALDAGGALSLEATAGQVALQASATADGSISLIATGDITQTAAGLLTTPTLSASSSGGSVLLATASPLNAVDAVSGSADGDFTFGSANSLQVGPVTAGDDLTIEAPSMTVVSALEAGAVARLTADTTLAVDAPVEGATGVVLTAGSISLTQLVASGAGADITLVTDLLTASGGASLQAGIAGDGGTLSIAPRTAGRDVALGGAAVANTLVVGDDVLAAIAAETQRLLVDGSTTSAVTVAATADLAARDVEQVELRGLSVAVNAALTADSGITLAAQNNVTQSALGRLTATTLAASSSAGSVLLATASPSNAVGTVSGSADGDFVFSGGGALTVGAVTAGDAVTVTGTSMTVTGAVQAGTVAMLTASAGTLDVQANITGTTGVALTADSINLTQQVASGAGAGITLVTDLLTASGAASLRAGVAGDGGTLSIAPRTAGRDVALGGAAVANTLVVGDDVIAAIAAETQRLLVDGSNTSTVTVQGDVDLVARDVEELELRGLSVAVDAALTVDTVLLRSDGAVTQTALITAGTLDVRGESGAAAGAVTLDLANAVDSFAAVSSAAVNFRSTQALTVTEVTAAADSTLRGDVSLAMSGAVDVGAANLLNLRSDGAVTQTAVITAGTLDVRGASGAAAGAVTLNQANAVGSFAAESSAGVDFRSAQALTVTGVTAAGDSTLRGDVSLALDGAVDVGAANLLNLRSDGAVTQTAVITAGTLDVRGASGAAAGAVTLDLANAVDSFAAVSSAGVDFRSAQALTVTGVTAAADSTLRGDVSLALDGSVDVGAANLLNLRSDGAVTQTAVITSGTLDVRGASGAAAGAITLDLANVVGSFAAESSAGMNFRSTQALTVTAVTAAADSTLRGDVSLALDGAVDVGAANLLNLRSDGAVTQTAVITAGTLDVRGASGAAAGAVTLDLANAVDNFAAASSAGVDFRSAQALTVTGVTAAADSTLRGDVSLALDGAVDVGAANLLNLRSDGAITQQPAGLITAGTVDLGGATGAAAGSVLLDQANVVANVTGAATGGLTFRSARTGGLTATDVEAGAALLVTADTTLTTAGTLRSTGATVTLSGDTGVTQTGGLIDGVNAVELTAANGAVSTAGDVISSAAGVTLSGETGVTQTAGSITGSGAVILTSASGEVSTSGDVTSSAAGVTLSGAAGVTQTAGSITGAGAVAMTATGGAVATSGAVQGTDVTLTGQDGVTQTAGSIIGSGAVALTSAGGGVTTAATVQGTTVTISGEAGVTQSGGSITGSGAVAMTSASGAVETSGAVQGTDVTLTGQDGVTQTAGSIIGSGAVALTSTGGGVTTAATVQGATVTLSGETGVTQSGGSITGSGAVAMTSASGAVETSGVVQGTDVTLTGQDGVTQTAGSIIGSGAVALTSTAGEVTTAATVQGATVTLSGEAGVTQSGGTITASGAVAMTSGGGSVAAHGAVQGTEVTMTSDGGGVTISGDVTSSAGDVTVSGLAGVRQLAGNLIGSGAVALTSLGGEVTTAATVQGTDVSLTGQSGVTQSAGSITGSGAVALTSAGGAVTTAAMVQGATVSLSGQTGVTQSGGSITGNGAVVLNAAAGAVSAAGMVRSTASDVTITGLSGNLAAGSTVRAAGSVTVTASAGGLASNGTLVSDGGAVSLQAQGGITQAASGQITAGTVALQATGEIETLGAIQADRLTATGAAITIGVPRGDSLDPTPVIRLRELGEVRATAGAAVIQLQGLSDGSETVVTGAQSGISGYTLRSTGHLRLQGVTVQTQAGNASILADGYLQLDPGSSVTAPGTVRLAAGQSPTLTQALLLDGVTLRGELVEMVVGAAGNTDGRLVANASTINAGTAVLFAAGGSIVTSDVTVAPTDPARLPLVIYDSRRTATALRAIPGAITADTADRPGLPAIQQSWQVSSADTRGAQRLFGRDDGSGPATAAAAGPLTLALDAGESPVFLLLDGGTATGVLTAGRLGVHGITGAERVEGDNTVALSGTLNGLSAGIAAQFGRATATLPSDQVRYRFNECVVGSVTCAAPSIIQPFVLPVQNRIDIRSDRPRLDPDVLLPNIAEEDY
ncbi:beta strand repeat-containing protein [Roseomonas sp. F4]